MKLLNKINRSYLLSSLIVIVPGLIMAYFLIIFISSDETAEILHGNEQRVVQQISNQNTIPSFYPLIDVKKVQLTRPFIMKDTTLFNPVSKENEAFSEYTTYRVIGKGTYRITVRTPIIEKNDVVLSLFLGTALLFLLIVSVLFLINKNINRHIWRPFYFNLQAIKSFSLQAGEKLTLQHSDITEFNNLNNQITRLTDKVVSDYQSLKEFTENASHELQTPLAVIQAKVEILFNNENLTKEQMIVLETIMENIHRLRRLNQSLLLLAKIENTQFNQLEFVHFNEFIIGILESMKEMFEVKDIEVIVKQEGKFTARMDLQLARQLINNLISNQLHHSLEKNAVQIIIKDDTITFINPGEKTLDKKQVFERFYKENKSKTSTGLGLSIVETICSLHHLTISYHFSEKAHYFVVRKEKNN